MRTKRIKLANYLFSRWAQENDSIHRTPICLAGGRAREIGGAKKNTSGTTSGCPEGIEEAARVVRHDDADLNLLIRTDGKWPRMK